MAKSYGWSMIILWTLAASRGATGQGCAPLAGSWTLTLGPKTFLVLSIAVEPGTAGVGGSLSRPLHFQTADSWSFADVHGGVTTEPIASPACDAGVLTFATGSKDDLIHYRMERGSASQVHLQVVEIPLPPLVLTRAAGKAAVSDVWEQGKTYTPDDGVASSAVMKAIFAEDQRAREPGSKIDWVVVKPADEVRRQKTVELLRKGELHTADDYLWASFVFQHGDTPDDYLMAHTLALVALRKGDRQAVWMTTATMDRYLQSIGKAQIFGTQFNTPDGRPTTMEPYDRTLISDALRHELEVPVQASQEERRLQYDRDRGLVK